MTKPFSLINELENQDTDPAHLKRNKIISILKKKFDFENSHLKSFNGKEKGILAKCFGYLAPDQAKELGIYPYFKEIEEIDGCRVVIDGKEAISVSTNNYLGLAQEPRVIEAARLALEKFGIGCTGSRFLNGTFNLHKNLEREISSFLNREDTIVMSTGFRLIRGQFHVC
tara:strand:- start:358 stop:867 length:510 start_codon:yes stop_codon:yes gene_type:complete